MRHQDFERLAFRRHVFPARIGHLRSFRVTHSAVNVHGALGQTCQRFRLIAEQTLANTHPMAEVGDDLDLGVFVDQDAGDGRVKQAPAPMGLVCEGNRKSLFQLLRAAEVLVHGVQGPRVLAGVDIDQYRLQRQQFANPGLQRRQVLGD